MRTSLIVNGGVLRHDGDPALALEIVAVHRALGDALVGAERAALMEERIDQRGLAVVDVRDDGDVPPGRIGYRHLTSIPAGDHDRDRRSWIRGQGSGEGGPAEARNR